MTTKNDRSVWKVIDHKHKMADQALDKNDPGKAERLLRELVDNEPEEPLFHWKRGYALIELQKYRQAIGEFRRALQLDPRNIATLGGLGRAYMELGKWQQAERAIKDRLSLKESPQHYVFLAHILMAMDRYKEAAETCLKAIKLDPLFSEAFLNLGLAYRHQKRIDEAIKVLRKAVELDDRYSVAWRELGLVLYAAHKLSLAKKALLTCLAIDPNDAWAHLYLALCLENLNDLKGAGRHFIKALKNDPKNAFIAKKYKEFITQKLNDKKPTLEKASLGQVRFRQLREKDPL
jgi:tetratricopeptide (TPR) repeat protein